MVKVEHRVLNILDSTVVLASFNEKDRQIGIGLR
jgi:hypothetical protein